MATAQPKHEGIRITIAGTELVVPPLNLRALRKLGADGHLQHLTDISGALLSAAQTDAFAATIAAAVGRNYPDLGVDWVLDNVELEDIVPLLTLILNSSGFREQSGPKAESPSSTTATGAGSSGTSPATPAGPPGGSAT